MGHLLQLSLWTIRRRFRRAWLLTVVTVLGILTSVILLSSTALYSQALAETGVRHALFSRPPSTTNVQVIAQNRPIAPEDYQELRNVAEGALRQRIGHLVVGQERFGRSQAGMPLTTDPERRSPPLDAPAGRLFFMTGFTDHSRVVAGDWPRAPGTSGPGGADLDVVVGTQVAKSMSLEIGSQVFVTPFRTAPEERMVLNVVGLVEPLDSHDPYWMGLPDQFAPQSYGEELVIPAYVTEGDFFDVVGRRFPTVVGDFGFNVFTDPSRITAGTVDATQASLEGLEADINKVYPRTFVLSRIGLTLEEYERDLLLARVPMYVYVSLVVILLLYFLALIAVILGRSQADELGLLRARGATVAQVWGVMMLAECALASVAVAVGPPLAWLIVRFLLLPTLGDVGGGPVEIGLTADAFWAAALGAALSVAVLTVSVAGRARSGVVEAMGSRSRPPSVSLVHRYYLDLAVVLVVGLVWWQFQERDGFVSRSLEVRGLELDPSIVVGPVLALLAAGLLLMRALPLLTRLVFWVAARAGPGWSSMALARLARDPVLPSSLAVMLMIAAALGVFGATFQSSLTRSQTDQAQHRIGGEVVLAGPGIAPQIADDLSAVPGVQSATRVLRESVNLIAGHSSSPATLIAASPGALSQSSWFREDFSEGTLDELSALIDNPPVGQSGNTVEVPLPPGTERIGVWLDPTGLGEHILQGSISVWARLTDSQGGYSNVKLGDFAGPDDQDLVGWRFLEAPLPDRLLQSERQWSLAALYFSTSAFVKVTEGSANLDDFTALGPGMPQRGMVLESFDDPGNWTPFGVGFGVSDRVELTHGVAGDGDAGLRFSWVEPFVGQQRGIHLPPVSLPLPAIGGAGLVAGQLVQIQHGRSSFPVRVVATADMFPTITNSRLPFLVMDLDGYLSYLEILPPGGLDPTPRQVWLSLDPQYDREALAQEITAALPDFVSYTDREAEAARASANPLAGGGWNALTGLGVASIGLAVLTVLLLHSSFSVQAGRLDTAVARALGLSSRQVFLPVTAERWLMAGVAIAIGAAIGYWPGIELVKLLDLANNGGDVVPPLIPSVHVALLASTLCGLVIAVTASVGLGALLARRLNPAEVLREGV